MRDIDYGVNAERPENVIAVILDDAQTAQKIMEELDGLGFVIVRKGLASPSLVGVERPEDVARATKFLATVRDVLRTRFPRCRDCADDGPVCPNSGLPCDLAKEFDVVIAALPPLRAREEMLLNTLSNASTGNVELLKRISLLNDENFKLQEQVTALSGTAGQEWREPLVEFVRWAISEASFVGSDLNGGDIQDKAEKLGILIKTKYDPAIHGDHEEAEPGDDWYVLAPFLAEKSQS